jgi:enoyl-CoA hydratase
LSTELVEICRGAAAEHRRPTLAEAGSVHHAGAMSTVAVTARGPVTVVTIDRPDRRNAVDPPTAAALLDAFTAFDQDSSASVAVLTGSGGTFCAGADLRAAAAGRLLRVTADGPGPMGPTRLELSKPVIAAVEGFAVAGGLELAIWCDLRVAGAEAVFGVFCRRFGVPLIDGGTVRLPRLIGQGRALDLILSGREVGAEEALAMGLANRVVPAGRAVDEAVAWGEHLAALPQTCMRNDRLSTLAQWGRPLTEAMATELRFGLDSLASPDAAAGARGFASGAGRHGTTLDSDGDGDGKRA